MIDFIKPLLMLAAFVALLTGALMFSCSLYRECRRIHPWWYCAADGGGK